jgi:hypothetical protein
MWLADSTAARLDAQGKLVVFGDLTSRDNYKRKEKLWQSNPENPAYFAEYSQGFNAAERYWIARDELGRMDPARPAMSVYEYRTAAQLHKEMREVLHLPTP